MKCAWILLVWLAAVLAAAALVEQPLAHIDVFASNTDG